MNSVFFDPVITDDERREQLYAGQLFVYSAPPGSQKLVELARQMIEEAFGNRNPELAQHDMPVEEYAALLTDLKPRFIHHPRTLELLRALLCDLSGEFRFVERIFFKADRECLDPLGRVLCRKRGHRRRIDPAGKQNAERHVRHQPHPHGVGEQLF